MMLKKLGLTLLIAAGLSVGVLAQDPTNPPAPGTGPAAEISVTGGDEDALRAFIRRYVVGNSQGQSVNITIGSLPTDLPVTVSVPPDASLYGTVARLGENDAASYYDIAYDTTETPQALLDFYKQTYTSPDWQITNESVTPAAAFSGQTNAYATFCYQQGVATMNLNGYSEGRGITNVNVTVQVPGDFYTCTAASQGSGTDPVFALIPSLALPEGVNVQSNMNAGFSYYTPNNRSNSMGAILESARPLADIATDYNAQLAATGWQAIFSENSEHTAFSTWTLTDTEGKTWHGSLLIAADNTLNVYNAVIYIEE